MRTATNDSKPDRANRALLPKFTLVAIIMLAFGYLLVPFYERIGKATGLRDIDAPDAITNTQDATRTVRLALDVNVNKLPWRFRPDTPVVDVHPGQLMNLRYDVENNASASRTNPSTHTNSGRCRARVRPSATERATMGSERSASSQRHASIRDLPSDRGHSWKRLE